MKANFEYISDVMERAIEHEEKNPAVDRAAATRAGQRVIGGFRVHDEHSERAALDRMIQQRQQSITRFRDDGSRLLRTLKDVATPLAVVPTGGWLRLCRESGLYVLRPNESGQIAIARDWHADVKNPDKWPIEKLLPRMMPNGVSLSTHRDPHGGRRPTLATLVLPDPPADVAATLLRAQSLTLVVAAVPEAIRFVERPSELIALAHPRDAWARDQGYADYDDWVRRDPIVFVECETATAIIAQFGDFPIERETVDRAVAAHSVLSRDPTPLDAVTPSEWMRGRERAVIHDINGHTVEIEFDVGSFVDSARWTGRA